jgi:hypothetical protein
MKTFLDTPDERHSFVIGFFEVLCPWPPRVKIPQAKPDVLSEYHYYLFGRGIGILALAGFAKLIQVLFF